MYTSGVNYNRQIIKEYFHQDFRLNDSADIPLEKLSKWIEKLNKINKDNSQEIKFEVSIEEEYQGCNSYEYTHTLLKPFIERLENDTEYNKRIAKEEKELTDYKRLQELKQAQYQEYLKDMKEYNRIVEKYSL